MRIYKTFPVLLLALMALPALADRIYLKDGRVIEGSIVSQSDTEVKIDIGKHGAALTFLLEQVDKIERSAGSPEQLYEGHLLLADRKNPDSMVELADWCAKNHLEKKAGQHYMDALELQSDNPRARGRLTELGYREIDGKWLSKEEQEKLANKPPDLPKPEPKVPTSEDVAREQGKCVVAVWAKDVPGIGVWASADGMLWVAGPAAAGTLATTVEFDGKKNVARVVARDRLRQIAVWKVDGVHTQPAKPSFDALPQKDPLVALTASGSVANVFARGWDHSQSEVWQIRVEGTPGCAAIFELSGRLIGVCGDAKMAVGTLDLSRLLRMTVPAPEGEQNAAGSYWRATDLADGPALEMVRAGAKLDSFEPGLGLDEMNRVGALARELSKLGQKLGGDIDDHVAALRLVRHLARARRLDFSLAAAEILRAQGKSILETLPKLSPSQIQRLRATVEGLGPDPAGMEASVSGEAERLESITIGAKEARALLDMQMAGYAILGPEPVESLESGVTRMYDAVHAGKEFALKVRAACGRPDPSRRDDLLALDGATTFERFGELRKRAFEAMTAKTAIQIAIRLRETRATSGNYPDEVPTGFDDPATGKPFDYKREGRGFVLISPGGEMFRVRE